MAKERKTVISRILGQSFVVGDVHVKLVAVNRNKARLEVILPEDLEIEDFDDFQEIIRNTLVMQDDKGWRRAIPRKEIEARPEHPEQSDT